MIYFLVAASVYFLVISKKSSTFAADFETLKIEKSLTQKKQRIMKKCIYLLAIMMMAVLNQSCEPVGMSNVIDKENQDNVLRDTITPPNNPMDEKPIEPDSSQNHTVLIEHKHKLANFDNMDFLKRYSEKFGIKEVTNELGELRQTKPTSIVFPNGWVASIVTNEGNDSDKKYSVAMCDYEGYFNWTILNEYGAIKGCLYCDNELEIILACETIRELNPKFKGKWELKTSINDHFNDIGEKIIIEIQLKYDDMIVFDKLPACSDCPFAFMHKSACGDDGIINEHGRKDTCRLTAIDIDFNAVVKELLEGI